MKNNKIIISRIDGEMLINMDTTYFEYIVYKNFIHLSKVNNGSNHSKKEINRLCNSLNSFVLVATCNNQIVGYVLGEKINLKQFNVLDNRNVFYVTYLYTVPKFRKMGIGTTLLDCVTKTKKYKSNGIMLTFDTANKNLYDFYIKNKFSRDKLMTSGNRWDVYYRRYY
jgi:ribosomal protein S18 acetylase RimI-like enzyme